MAKNNAFFVWLDYELGALKFILKNIVLFKDFDI